MLLALTFPTFAGLLINEVVYDPTSTDDGAEWIELCNNGTTDVDLTGYVIESAGSSFDTSYELSSYTIAPGEYLVIGGPYATTFTGSFDPNLQNGGTDLDGVRLVDGTGVVVDTVLYNGSQNSSGLADDLGNTSTIAAAPGASGAESIGRTIDCFDSDDASLDFSVFATPTPGAYNTTGGTDEEPDCSVTAGVVVNEFTPATDAEWIEIYNGSGSTVELEYWQLQWGTSVSSGYSKSVTLGSYSLAPGAWFVVGSPGASYKDQESDMDLGNATSGADAIRLVCDDAVVDTVLYGSSNDGWTEDDGSTPSSVPDAPDDGKTTGRFPDGADSNASVVDFMACNPTAGSANDCSTDSGDPDSDPPEPDPADCSTTAGVVINEFTPETDLEWVEIYNGSGATVKLDSWLIAWETSPGNGNDVTIGSVTLAPGAYFVVGSPGAGYKDQESDMDLGNASSNADKLQLLCNGAVVDTVIYGDENEDGWTEDSGELSTSSAPAADDGTSAARIEDGYDTQQSGLDFLEEATPTPGAANNVYLPPVCQTEDANSVKINELLYDSVEDDTTQEWIEIYNGGSLPVRLDGWMIEAGKSSWDVQYVFPSGVEIPAGGFLVVGAEEVAEADYIAEDLDLGNGTEGDGVKLRDCALTERDMVLYGETLEDELLDTGDTGSSEVVPTIDAGLSMGRYPDGADTNTPDDWSVYFVPTPGESNGEPTDPPQPELTGCGHREAGQGCGSRSPAERGCSVLSPLGGWEVMLAAFVMLRRRK